MMRPARDNTHARARDGYTQSTQASIASISMRVRTCVTNGYFITKPIRQNISLTQARSRCVYVCACACVHRHFKYAAEFLHFAHRSKRDRRARQMSLVCVVAI